ncbi:metalloregulator ArsR/SmtB family transcription factor [Deferribacter thermophilus]|uniref:ArsR/SmtB family transcription factor n=1 Tax=Deferribacter thermophilus TaxID=53573 RepID=UPI003C29244E
MIEKFLKAISDKTRLRILNLINFANEICVCDLENTLKLKQSTLSTHLSKLNKVNILTYSKNGKWSYYRINNELDKKYLKLLKNIIEIFKNTEIAKSDIKNYISNKDSCSISYKILIVDDKNDLYSQILEKELSKKENINVKSAGLNPADKVSLLLKQLYPDNFKNFSFFTKSINNFLDYEFDIIIHLITNKKQNLPDLKAKKLIEINIQENEQKLTIKELKKLLIKKCVRYL